MPKYTIADIAREAGVSKSTVSRYFNDGYVKEETKEKIKAVIERTGFEPSAAASNLKSKQTRMIGVVAPTMTSPSTGRLLNAMDNTLRELGYACLIITTDHQSAREIAAIEYLRSLRVDGIVLIATNLGQEHQALQKSSSIPFLVMGQNFPYGISIVYDDYHAGFAVGEYASQMGHRNITYIGVSGADFAVGHERKRGVMDGLSRHVQVDSLSLSETTFSYEQAREAARKILDQRIPDLIICATDQIALACFKEARLHNLAVPEDVSIIGFGGYDVGALLTPTLASVHFPNTEAGQLCARTIVQMIQGEPVPKLQVLGFEFDPGQSVNKRKTHDDLN